MEKRLTSGIYRACAPSGGSYIGFSHNVVGTLKRLRFELTLNACSYKALQTFWNECGPLELSVLEETDFAGMDDVELDAHMRAKLISWQNKLGEGTKLIQQSVTL